MKQENAEDPDAMLMLEAAGGSEGALRILVEKWKNPLMNYFYRSVCDVHISEDLAQQTFINLWKARAGYSASAKFSTYLFYIARRVLISRYRKESRRRVSACDPADLDCQVDGRESLDVGELEELFYLALKELPENQRTAILLLKQQELSYEQIAETMGASVQAVKTWVHRARLALREVLRKSRM